MDDYPFRVVVLRDDMGRFFCRILGVGMFETEVNVTLPYPAAKELAEAILAANKFTELIR